MSARSVLNSARMVARSASVIDEQDEHGPFLSHPPSVQGERAMVLLSQLRQWAAEREDVLQRLRAAEEEVFGFVVPLVSSQHGESRTIAESQTAVHVELQRAVESRKRLKKLHETTEGLYAQFTELDAMVTAAQRELDTVYDSHYLRFVFRSTDERSMQPCDAPTDTAEAENLDSSSSIIDPTEVAKASYETLFRAIKDPRIVARNPPLARAVQCICRTQAVMRGRKTRQRLRALRHARWRYEQRLVEYRFADWRMHTRATHFNRHRLLRQAFSPLLANANLAVMRRGEFALRYSNCRLLATLRRALLMWRRYTAYINAPIAPCTRERLITFDTPLAEWDRFLSFERRRRDALQRGSLLRSGDPLLCQAYYMQRWRRYILRRHAKVDQAIRAQEHHRVHTLARHFHGWTDIVAFSSQREATRTATLQCTFAAWRRQAFKQRSESARLPLLQPFKKLTVLATWRRKAVALRRQRASANLLLFAHRRVVLHALYCWRGDGVQQRFIEMWQRWVTVTRQRRWFRMYTAARWGRQTHHLMGVCFTGWASVCRRLASREHARVKRSGSSFLLHRGNSDAGSTFTPERHAAPLSFYPHQSTHELIDEFKQCRLRSAVADLTAKIHFVGQLIDEQPLAELLPPATSPARSASPVSLSGSGFHEDDAAERSGSPGSGEDRAPLLSGAATIRATNRVCENIFAREVPLSTPAELRGEVRVCATAYREWAAAHARSGARDLPLLRAIVLLRIAHEKGRIPPLRRSCCTTWRAAAEQADDGQGDVDAQHAPAASQALQWTHQTILCIGQPVFNAATLELSVGALEEAVREEAARATVVMARKAARERRILAKASARISAMKLFALNDAYTCSSISSLSTGFSPFRMLLEHYQAQCPRSASKLAVPLPQLPRRRHLAFLLRLHLGAIVAAPEHQANISARRILALKVRKALLLTSLAKLWIGNARDSTAEALAEKRLAVLDRVIVSEECAFRRAALGPRMQRLIPAHFRAKLQLPPRPHVSLMNILGFNPLFLRGAHQQKARKQMRLRQAMRAEGELAELAGLRRRGRTQSMLVGTRTVAERAMLMELLLHGRPRSAPMSARGELFATGNGDYGEEGEDGGGAGDAQRAAAAAAAELLHAELPSTAHAKHVMDGLGAALLSSSSLGDSEDAVSDAGDGALRRAGDDSALISVLSLSGDDKQRHTPLSRSAEDAGAPQHRDGVLRSPRGCQPLEDDDDTDDDDGSENGWGRGSAAGATGAVSSGAHRGGGLHERSKALAQKLRASSDVGGRRKRGKRGSLSVDSIDLAGDYTDDGPAAASPSGARAIRSANAAQQQQPRSQAAQARRRSSASSRGEVTRVAGETETETSAAPTIAPHRRGDTRRAAQAQSVAALAAPKLRPTVGPLSAEQRLLAIEAAAQRRRERRAKIAGEGACGGASSGGGRGAPPAPRLWATDGETVPAAERLLEITSRFGATLSDAGAASLEALKIDVFRLTQAVEGRPVAQAPDPREARRELRLRDVPPPELEGTGPRVAARSDSRSPRVRQPLYSPPPPDQVRFPIRRAPHRRAEVPRPSGAQGPPQTASAGMPADFHHGDVEHANVEHAVVADDEPVRRQLLHVPRRVLPRGEIGVGRGADAAAVHTLMSSTALLINEYRTGDTFTGGEQSPQLGEKELQRLRRHPRKGAHPEQGSAQTPHPSCPAPVPESRLQRRVAGADDRTDTTSDFDTWVRSAVVRLVDEATHDDTREEVVLQRSLLLRHLHTVEQRLHDATTTAERNVIHPLQTRLHDRLDAVAELLRLRPSRQLMDATLFMAAAEVRAFTPAPAGAPSLTARRKSASAGVQRGTVRIPLRDENCTEAPTLSDRDVSRLVSFLVSQA